MTTVLEFAKTGDHYILLGVGYARMAQAPAERSAGGGLHRPPDGKENKDDLLCICDAKGAIGWVRPDQVKVVSVDGVTPAGGLGGFQVQGALPSG